MSTRSPLNPCRPFLLPLLWLPALLLLSGPAHAAAAGSKPSVLMMTISLIGGLAFFLYGMDKMSNGLKQTAGEQMRSILATLTRNTLIGLIAGAVVTMIIQSSSATMVMVISFVQSQLMTFGQSLGVILGANIGTTVTAQLVAFKLTDIALVMVSVGFAMRMFAKSQKLQSLGEVLLGFGILFYGMKVMSDAMKPLRSSQEFINLMKGLDQPLLALLLGMLFTALVQSSSASIGVIIILAQQGLITLEAGIPLILGANIGTCVTAVLASIGTAREAKRVAMAYVFFEVVGVAAFLFWIPQFAALVREISATTGAGAARQIANAHTIFNVTLGIIFLPVIGSIARLITFIYPDKPQVHGVVPVTWHLDEAMLATPSLAIELARAEIARMAKILFRMHRAAIYPFVSAKPRQDAIYPHLSLIEGIEMREKKIDFLEKQTRNYLLKLNSKELTQAQSLEISTLISLLDTLEGIGDIITKFVVPLITKKQQLREDFSNEGKRELIVYHRKVGQQLQRLQEVMTTLTYPLAKKVKTRKHRYAEMASGYRQAHLQRMFAGRPESLETHSVHVELMDAIRVIGIHAADIADLLMGSGILSGQEATPATGNASPEKADSNDLNTTPPPAP